MTPRVSVFVFCRNGARTIRGSVESVLRQSYADFEYVVQDGGSSDGTLDLLREYGDPRIRLRSEPDAGPSDGFWRAIRRCRGELVAACLADEELLPDALAEGVAALEAQRDAVAITRDADLVTLEGQPMGTAHGRPFDLLEYMAGRFTPNFAAAMFRAAALESVGLHTREWDPDCGEFELWCRLALLGPVAYVPGSAARYAIHVDQLSSRPENVARVAEGRLRVIERLARETPLFDGRAGEARRCRRATAAHFSRQLLRRGCSDLALELSLPLAGESGVLPPPGPPAVAMFEYVRLARRQQVAGNDALALMLLEASTRFAEAQPELLCEVAAAQAAAGFVDPALATCEAALAGAPQLADAHWLRGVLLERRGLIDEALDAWRRSDIRRNADRHSLYLNAMLKSPTATSEGLLAAHREWARLHVTRPAHLQDFRPPPWAPGERITIGYACSYWDVDTITYQLLPLLRRHDRRRFRIVSYAPLPPGPLASAAVDEIRLVGGMSREEYVRQVRADGVHILIELNGFTVGHWFAAMASRCAPVQISYLNYTSTCGVDEVDYLLADGISLPPGQDDHFTEQVHRLPGCFFCFTYEGTTLPPVAPPPSLASGRVTFGCFGSGSKINPPLLDLWAEILRRMPDTCLFIRNHQLTPVDNRRALARALGERGIPESRLLLLPGADRQEVLESYDSVDVSLDTFPYCGGNTIAESLWQGVPVVTLKGHRFSSAYGASLLTASGLAELVAGTPEEYVDKAVALAADPRRLADYRGRLRTMVHEFGFSDADGFILKLEAAYLDMVSRAYAATVGEATVS